MSIRCRLDTVSRLLSTKRFLATVSYQPPDFTNLNVASWNRMKQPIRDEISEYLAWKMEDSWHNVTKEEMKAAYFISFGKWGPRAASGSKDAQMQMSTPEIIVRGLSSMILFTAVIVAIMNYKQDKDLNAKLEGLRELK
ncbi:HHL086Wp [Eremothecium sinecaudum]|uniref:HHL086Wp n=1 Tax=Eremothecium sinecaudum TaxID=45286 RepID=A0A0X8HWA5_9SACH|nr:HHL086Wp [Eremothecium sinecaudum]AMD22684.1 HHL086Wp [Eremothecium sinecaudum]